MLLRSVLNSPLTTIVTNYDAPLTSTSSALLPHGLIAACYHTNVAPATPYAYSRRITIGGGYRQTG